nr:Usher syndrome type-1G protein homolog [Onthophagus taurus]
MTSLRFHKAAKDGYIEVLKEATRSDCNTKDEQGMTPTLYAAFYGHLDSLRLLCGRGGNPDKADHFGNTALHLAAAQGHKAVVTFLVNFGANIYAMDIDERTAKELAGISNREDIMIFLDQATAKLESIDKKKSKEMKEKAKKETEKRIKKFNKRQAKLYESVEPKIGKKSNGRLFNTLKNRIKSRQYASNPNLQNAGLEQISTNPSQISSTPRFSTIVSGNGTTRGVFSAVERKARSKQRNNDAANDDFKISEIEDGKRSIRSIRGLKGRGSEVLYTGQVDSKRGKLNDVFNGNNDDLNHEENDTFIGQQIGTLTRSISQPNILNDIKNASETPQESAPNVEAPSIFIRPGIGSLAFRKSITNTLQAMSMAEQARLDVNSIGSAGSLASRPKNFGFSEDNISDMDSSSDEETDEKSPLERFLTAWGLKEYLDKFEEQKIDLDTLLLLTEGDLKSLNLPLGPHRKLITAINERKLALESPGEIIDGKL